MKKKRNIFSLLFIALLLWGCIGPQQTSEKITYYTLEYPPPRPDGQTPLPCSLLLERFQVSPLYDSTRIIFRDRAYKRDAYFYHKWRANPGELIAYLLARDLRSSGLFTAVSMADRRIPTTHELIGNVDEFYEKDEASIWKGVLTLDITLIQKGVKDLRKEILFNRVYSTEEVCLQKNPQALAAAMSRALAKLSQEIISDIYHTLMQTKAASHLN